MWIKSRLMPWVLLITALVLLSWNTLHNYAVLNTIRTDEIIRKELGNLKCELTELRAKVANGSWLAMDTILESCAEDTKTNEQDISSFKGIIQSIVNGNCKESPLDIYEKVDRLVAIENKFDKTGMVDFALESSGGKIMSVRNTQSFDPHGSDSKTLFGVKVCDSCMQPQAILQTNSLPGECWAFKGSSGLVVIQLLGYVYITQVALEHIPKQFSPTGRIDSAPKDFSIWGLADKDEYPGDFLGRFVYDINGPPLQKFKVSDAQRSYLFVQLKIHTNYGNIFTCVYRFRVHGNLDEKTNFVGE